VQQQQERVVQQQQAHQQQQTQIWMQQQDTSFEQDHPEWRDPAVKQKEQAQVMEYLTRERGMTMPQIEYRWNNDIAFRDAHFQAGLLDAARYHAAKARAAQVTAKIKHAPPVQRPGVSRDKAWIDHDNLRALESRLGVSGNARDAARLLIERRRASR
jgi:hypothetical protein